MLLEMINDRRHLHLTASSLQGWDSLSRLIIGWAHCALRSISVRSQVRSHSLKKSPPFSSSFKLQRFSSLYALYKELISANPVGHHRNSAMTHPPSEPNCSARMPGRPTLRLFVDKGYDCCDLHRQQPLLYIKVVPSRLLRLSPPYPVFPTRPF